MPVIAIPKPLREKLGEDAIDAFISVINNAGFDSRKDLATKDDLNALRSATKDDLRALRDEMKAFHSATKDDINALRISTKDEIKTLRDDMKAMRSEVKDEMNTLRNEFKDDILALQNWTQKEIYSLNERFTKLDGEMRLIKWMLGIMIAGILSLVLKAFFI
ncbi:hypothetical protein MCHI_001935 [Candidatus Magnetoovum chiemensis]|nr:hypothetical protein MCHI_001935 [Candidatus Magnetoovum chiemensis]